MGSIAWAELGVGVIIALLSSGGLWAYLMKRNEKKSDTTKLLMGLGLDKILFLGGRYLEKGWISRDEYHDFLKYLYEPYRALGGNGMAEKMMEEINELPVRNRQSSVDISFSLQSTSTPTQGAPSNDEHGN